METLSAFFSEMKYGMSVDNSAVLCGFYVEYMWIRCGKTQNTAVEALNTGKSLTYSILLNIIFHTLQKCYKHVKEIVMIRIYPGSDDNGGCDVASEDYGLLQKMKRKE